MDVTIVAVAAFVTVIVAGWLGHHEGASRTAREYQQALATARVREKRLREQLDRLHDELADVRRSYRPGAHP